jgi:DNA-binding CsgD family transcriptional regulator/tetratricopeptide (TPR) repeat protein
MEHEIAAKPALVGRWSERAIIERRLTALEQGQGALVLVSGEPGIGKSALATAIVERGRESDAAVALGRCYEGSGQPPFAPWGDVLADLAMDDESRSTLLPPPFGEGPAAQTAYQLMHTVATHLQIRACDRSLVLVLEDVHWADRDGLELLEVATRNLSRTPILAIATYRPEAVHRSHPLYDVLPRLQRDRPVDLIRLVELTVDDTVRLVEAHGESCSADLASYLHTRADGHPLFVIELMRDLVERRLLPVDGMGRLLPPTTNVPVSPVLTHLIGHRVARLGADVEALLIVAAVAGEEWDLGTVEAVLGWEEEPLLRALDGALNAEAIVPADQYPERYRFRHALIREVLYQDQVLRRRKHLHHRLGTVLEAAATNARDINYVALAYHFSAAEEWERAVRYGIAAGDAARDRYAGHGALLAYQQALAALDRAPSVAALPQRTALLERLGRAHLVLGEQEAAAEAFQRMLAAAQTSEDRASEARSLSWISFVRRRLYHPVASRTAAEAALRAAQEVGDPRLLALAHWSLGQIHEIAGDLDPATEHAREAERLARAEGDRDVLSRSLLIVSHVAIWRGRFYEGLDHAEESARLARAGHDALAVAGASWRLGLALGEIGRYDAARHELLAGIALADATGEGYYLAKLQNTIGWLHQELGDPDGAAEWDRRALTTVRGANPDRVTEAERHILLNLAMDDLAAGRVDAAAAQLDAYDAIPEVVDYVRFRYLNRSQVLRAEIALARGDVTGTLRAAEDAANLASAKAAPKYVAKSRLLQGRALLLQDRPHDAVPVMQESVDLADRLGHGSLRWQSRLWLAQAYDGLLLDATRPYREAWEHISSIAADLESDDLRARFLASPLVDLVRRGIESAAPRPIVAGPAGLTIREIEVLRLLVRRQTDVEIAEALFISRHTASTHVKRILAKLGAANRREVAALAARYGLV